MVEGLKAFLLAPVPAWAVVVLLLYITIIVILELRSIRARIK